MKVLLTDDSAFMRAIIKASLKDVPGIEIMEAENGDVAVELYRNYRFDVVFLDIIMPVKNGIMAMEEIRQLDPQARIIFVTSVSQDEMIQKAQSLGANAFLAKPFQPNQILEVFTGVLNGQQVVVPVLEAATPAVAAEPAPLAAPVAPEVLASVVVQPPVASPAPLTPPWAEPVPAAPPVVAPVVAPVPVVAAPAPAEVHTDTTTFA